MSFFKFPNSILLGKKKKHTKLVEKQKKITECFIGFTLSEIFIL